ncbi:phage head morphogenesis protein [Staphylococcus arlettae]
MNKKNPKIENQDDIEKYIELMQQQVEKEIEVVFANRLKVILQTIALLFEKYQQTTVYATWTEFNKYNRLNKELIRIAQMLNGDYRKIIKAIQNSQKNIYIKRYYMSLYLYEMASQKPMDFDVPSPEVIKSAIEQPIDQIKLKPTLEKHRNETIKKIRINITQGVMSGEGYSKIAKTLRQDIGMTKTQSLRVARTETGRAMSQAGIDSAKVAKDNGLNMKKKWFATKDTRTRHTHRHLDGKAIDINDNFQSSGCIGQAPKLFVGINSAKENINCRCKLLYYIDEDELPTVMRVRNDDDKTEVIPFMTYTEWEKQKLKG